jgi:hypothetical protein
MNNEHFQKRVRDLARSDEFHIDLYKELSDKHKDLINQVPAYSKSLEFYFLSEFIKGSDADKQLLYYFRFELLQTDPAPWRIP